MKVAVSSHWELEMPYEALCQKALFGFRQTEGGSHDSRKPHFAMAQNSEGIDFVLLEQHQDGIVDDAEGFVTHSFLQDKNITYYKDCNEMVADYLKECGCEEFVFN